MKTAKDAFLQTIIECSSTKSDYKRPCEEPSEQSYAASNAAEPVRGKKRKTTQQQPEPAISKTSLPDWYSRVDRNTAHNRSLVIKLKKIREAVDKCKDNPRGDLSQTFDELREAIHDAEFRKVDGVILRNTRLLEPSLGLPLIFNDEEVGYPFDLVADSQELWNKWCRRVFDPDLMRGIETAHKNGKKSDSLLSRYEGRVAPDQFGANGLVNGQWFPSQLATVRDGAHGSAQAGIYGKKGEGAYSIVLAGGHHTGGRYDDIDNGDDIWYCGTDGDVGQISEGTSRMLESINCHLVRVLRSHNLPQDNPHRPEKGYRYDGLYNVVGHELVDATKQAYRFHLIRQPGQTPIRSKAVGKAERPTRQEKAEYEKIRALLSSMGEKV